tara:strand:+ start:39 stop:692 length:654 start_codon:yes stop_codon:yes gene_type:complete
MQQELEIATETTKILNANYSVSRISRSQTEKYILEIHYAKRFPQIKYAFGLFKENLLVGIVTYGIPASRSLCKGIAGKEYINDVLELNRLCLLNNLKNEASMLVASSLKQLPKPKIIVSYADSSQNHVGYVYQATNFTYTGLSDKHKEWRMLGSNVHSKNICKMYSLEERKNNPDKFIHIDRPRKHRYIYICSDKRYKKKMLSKMKYATHPYPKCNS